MYWLSRGEAQEEVGSATLDTGATTCSEVTATPLPSSFSESAEGSNRLVEKLDLESSTVWLSRRRIGKNVYCLHICLTRKLTMEGHG